MLIEAAHRKRYKDTDNSGHGMATINTHAHDK
jgi:hypothetical protein